MSKLFEMLLLDSLSSSSDYDQYQFGFKRGHSTGLCTAMFKHTVDYYRGHGSHVFVCFIDFSKAFENVNYWKLFYKLLDDNDSSIAVRVLAYWHSTKKFYQMA